MSIDREAHNPLYPFSRGPQQKGQIRFDPSDEFRHELLKVLQPKYRAELAGRAIYLSSLYSMMSHIGPDSRNVGANTQIADDLQRALQFGQRSHNRLGKHLQQGVATINDRQFIALKFAVHLPSRVRHEIWKDDLLKKETLLRGDDPSVEAAYVYEADKMLKGDEREAKILKLRQFVMGHNDSAEGSHIPSPNPQAYTTNLRLEFVAPHQKGDRD